MPSIKVDSYIEDGLINALKANAYVIANNIPVMRYHDASEDKVLPCIIVHADPAESLEATNILWSSKVNIYSRTKPADDTDKADMEAMNDAVQGVVANLTPDQLHTYSGSPSGLGFYRIWNFSGEHKFSDEGIEQEQACKFEVISETA